MNTLLHSRTPMLNVIDSRGLPVRQVAYWRCDMSAPYPESRTSTWHYDGAGHLVEQRDARFTQPTGRANLIRHCSLSGSELLADSVDAGWQAGLKDACTQGLESWDGRGRNWQQVYDDQLRLIEVRERQGSADFLTCERLSYGSHSPFFADHNQCGQLIRHDDPSGVERFKNYGLTGQVVEQTRQFATGTAQPDWSQPLATLELDDEATTHSLFNALGDLCEQVDAKNIRQILRQNVSGRLGEVQLQLEGDAIAKVLLGAIRYSAHGQAEQEVAGNGVISTRSYRPESGRLDRLHVRSPEGAALQALQYEYDPVGNVLSIEDKAQPIRFFANVAIEPLSRFGYDSLYQLIEATGFEAGEASKGPASVADPMARMPYRQTYRYDPGGNLLELTHAGPQHHGHRLVAAASSNRCLPVREGVEPTEEDFRRGFDAGGNLLQLQPGWKLTWNSRNQLSEVCPVVREGGVNDSERYAYDAQGRRVRKVNEAHTQTGSVVSEVRYLPGLEVRTRSATGQRLWVIDIEAGHTRVQVLHWENDLPPGQLNDSCRYSFTDHLGSCALEVDALARVISRQVYHPFGTTAVCERGDSSENSYRTQRYAGKELDATGLYYYGLRYYAPWLQRWLNPDPAGSVDGLNPYRMVKNNPVLYTDVLGLVPEDFNRTESAPVAEMPVAVARSPGLLSLIGSGLGRFGQDVFNTVRSIVSAVSSVYRHVYRSVQGVAHEKSVTLNYPDFTIKQFELHSPSAPKELMILAHGRLQSPVHKIYSASHNLSFYTHQNQDMSAAPNDFYRFQARKLEVEPVEEIHAGEESRDYKLMRTPEAESRVSSFFHQGQLLNSKPEITSLSDLGNQNFHDVLTIKPGRDISLSKILKQVPGYSQVHCFFCRSRNGSPTAYEPFAKRTPAAGH